MRYEIWVMRYEICLIFKPIISQPITHNPYHISYISYLISHNPYLISHIHSERRLVTGFAIAAFIL